MSRFQKFCSITFGLLSILSAVMICIWPEEGYRAVVLLIGGSLVLSGVKDLWYFISMARFMVGGKFILYLSIIYLQVGFFTLSLDNIPKVYVMLYLIVIHAFSGMIALLNARESLTFGSPAYKKELVNGSVNICLAILCLVFIKYLRAAVMIYAAGLVYSGVVRIRKGLEKREMVYIR